MELVVLALAGGLLSLDGTSVGQFMVSRPLVAGAITGWLLGEPTTGLLVGALLELYLLVSFPSGGARFPEGATGTVVAVAAVTAVDAPGALPMGVAVGLVWGQVGGFSITLLRKLNARMVPEPTAPGAARPRAVMRAHLSAIGLDLLRGTLVTGLGVALGPLALAPVAHTWPLGLADSTGLLLVGGAASAGIFLRTLGGFRARPALFLAGVILGLLGGRLL